MHSLYCSHGVNTDPPKALDCKYMQKALRKMLSCEVPSRIIVMSVGLGQQMLLYTVTLS